jgi:hypothetical protein
MIEIAAHAPVRWRFRGATKILARPDHSNLTKETTLPLASSMKIRARIALIAALAMLSLGAMSVSAQATQVEWWNSAVGAGRWVGPSNGSTHMLSSTVYYTGSGTVNVCEEVIDVFTNVYSLKCGNQFAEATPAELEPHLGTVLFANAKNNSGFTHTIHGVYVQ